MPAKTPEQRSEAALNYLIGEVMKKTQGRANPQAVRALILERIGGESTASANPVP